MFCVGCRAVGYTPILETTHTDTCYSIPRFRCGGAVSALTLREAYHTADLLLLLVGVSSRKGHNHNNKSSKSTEKLTFKFILLIIMLL